MGYLAAESVRQNSVDFSIAIFYHVLYLLLQALLHLGIIVNLSLDRYLESWRLKRSALT